MDGPSWHAYFHHAGSLPSKALLCCTCCVVHAHGHTSGSATPCVIRASIITIAPCLLPHTCIPRHLRELDLAGASRLRDAWLSLLTAHSTQAQAAPECSPMHTLTRLSLRGCAALSVRGLEQLGSLTALADLDISGMCMMRMSGGTGPIDAILLGASRHTSRNSFLLKIHFSSVYWPNTYIKGKMQHGARV